MVDRVTSLFGLHDSMYLDLITINIHAIGEISDKDDNHDNNIDGLESNNLRPKGLFTKMVLK